jgi:ABC-type transport system involved in multi-copper enzyme maturation permease subunit
MPENGRQIFCALLRKEWQEQRWRFFLGTTVLSGLLAGLLRAQIIPNGEAALLIYGPVGLVMVVFLAMGSVASERADRTWEFLTVQPVSRVRLLRAKWAMGLAQLAGMMAIATTAGMIAMASRGFRQQPAFWNYNTWSLLYYFSTTYPLRSISVFALVATVSLACWYTPLFFLLTRARQEFTAALGGIFLTIALLVWLIQLSAGGGSRYFGGISPYQVALLCTGLLNPLSPVIVGFSEEFWPFLPVLLVLQVGLWIVLPVWLVGWKSDRLIQKWMQT